MHKHFREIRVRRLGVSRVRGSCGAAFLHDLVLRHQAGRIGAALPIGEKRAQSQGDRDSSDTGNKTVSHGFNSFWTIMWWSIRAETTWRPGRLFLKPVG